jgi:hypothetical protein
MNATPPLIRTQGLSKRYGDTLALDRLDLGVERGEVYGYLGPNGARSISLPSRDFAAPVAAVRSNSGSDCARRGRDGVVPRRAAASGAGSRLNRGHVGVEFSSDEVGGPYRGLVRNVIIAQYVSVKLRC